MSEVVNLNKARKARDKAARKVAAAQNRAAFGQDKAARALTKAEQAKARRILDAHRRDDGADG